MKINGKTNFITDKDIVITEGNNLGETLSDILDNQQSDLNQLKSNVKWLYKYGGIGSGGGSGTDASSWSLFATLDGSTIDNGKIIILTPDQKKYTLKIKILKGNGIYNVIYKYGTSTRTKTLDQTNNWEFVTTIDILGNGRISIEVTDNIDVVIKESQYVLHAYSLSDANVYKNYKFLEDGSLKIVNGLIDGTPYQSDLSGNTDIYLNEALEKGLCFACTFQRAIDAEISYSVFIDGENKKTETVSNDGTTGALFYEIIKKGDFESWKEDKAGAYAAEMNVSIIPTGGTGGDPVKQSYTKLFNIIPDNLYLRVTPYTANAVLYNDKNIENPYVYKRGTQAEFVLKTYWGSNSSRQVAYNFSVEYEDGTTWRMDKPIYTREQVDTKIGFTPSKIGWTKLIFTTTLSGATKEIVKYIYCDQVQTSYMWFRRSGEPEDTGAIISSGADIVAQEYFRPGVNSTSCFADVLGNIEQTSASSDIIFNLPFSSYNNLRDFTVNFAVQYSYINDLTSKILSLNYEGNSIIELCQNKVNVNVGGELQKLEIFIPKEENYSPNETSVDNSTKYHLITLAWTLYNISGSELWYQCAIYVDGILSGGIPVAIKNTMIFDNVTLHPGNYSINLIDVTYASVPEKTYNNTQMYHAFNDIDVAYYYNTYKSALGIEIPKIETLILDSFYTSYVQDYNASTYSLQNDLVKVSNSTIVEISKNLDVPTLMFECDEAIQGENKTILEWLNSAYEDGKNYAELDWKIPTKVYWSKGNVEIDENRPVTIPFNGNNTFTIAIQGSSTKNQKSKNLTLSIKSETEGTEKILFSPNFQSDDASTFLPEQEFTLKADIVDSSFSNNTSIGRFVNENNSKSKGGWFEYTKPGVDSNIRSHVKQCLEGFPVLIFLKVKSNKNIGGVIQTYDDYYYLGVYNFNLGRGSYYNLGYSDLTVFQTKDPEKPGYLGGEDGDFVFTSVIDAEPVNDFIAAEIQDNNKYWDFSQYQPSVLFPLTETETSGFMFGDIVSNSATSAYAKDRICKFVEKVAKAGGYIFKQIGKKFEPVGSKDGNVLSYHTIGTVPDYRTQYRRISGDVYEIDKSTDQHSVADDLAKCILVPDENQTQYLPSLNYESAAYYYTTCMVFGLVDSVQKNLNIKTWDPVDSITGSPQFGLYFYDMDTSLGIDNAGAETSYFCFSDFWKSSIEDTDEIDKNGIKISKNNGVIVYRDYVPENTNGAYDIPSSYLFAIPKYATLMGADYKQQFDVKKPQDIYLRWRNLGGALENADAFINNYFNFNFKSIPNTLLNLNYRNKYLYITKSEQFPQVVQRLLGTRLEKTRDWFKGRLRILDAYFNINRLEVPICVEDSDYQNGIISDNNNLKIAEAIPSVSTESSNNPDFAVYEDIFSNSGSTSIQRSGRVEFVATSSKYAPLLVYFGSSVKRYLFEEENKPYKFLCDFQGTLQSRFGGSSEWRTLDTINDFVKTVNGNVFNLNSDILLNVNSSEMVDWTKEDISTWNLNTPSAKDISLRSSHFSGELTINSAEKFANLVNLDLSGSKISLTLDGQNVKTIRNIRLDNINTGKVEINNANDLEDISINNVRITEFNVSPWFKSDMNISSSQSIKKLTVIGKDSEGTLNVSSNTHITNLNYSNFKHLYVNDCVELTSIICNDNTNDILESVVITNCPKIEELTIKIDNVHSIDLSNCTSLSKLILVGTKFDKLKMLNLSNTLIENITYKSIVNESGETSSILDLSRFINLSIDKDDPNSYFSIYSNHVVKEIQFANDKNKPIYLKKTFGSRTLGRIYGNFIVTVDSCFNLCTNFSIHGYNLNEMTWHNKSVLSDGVVLMPHQVLEKTIESINDDDLFQSGNLVTNLKVSNAGYSTFGRAACSLFDMYYTLTRGDELYNCDSMFYNQMSKNGDNIREFRGKNQPPREMFVKAPNITSLILTFYNSSGYDTVLLSPENNGEEILKDNGVFSPLVNLENLERPFGTDRHCFDRFLFRRKTGKYKLKLLGVFNGYHILNDVNNFNFEWSNTFAIKNLPSLQNMKNENWGDFSGFFDDLQDLENIVCFCRNAYFINYDKLCKIPKKITKFYQSYCAYYGIGTLRLNELFHNPSIITEIVNGPRLLSWNSDEWRPYFELNNDTFSEFINIERICSAPLGPTASSWSWDTGEASGDNNREHPFVRMNKVVTGSSFPYDMFKNNSKLREITGIFSYTNVSSSIQNVFLPGNIFRYTPELKRADWMFYNILTPYKLSESKFNKNWEITNNICNFAYCPKIENLDRAFGADELKYTAGANKEFTKEFPYLTGSIPPRFFFHGGSWIDTVLTGSNSAENGNYVEETINHRYYIPNRNITSMWECFTKNNLSSYSLSTFGNIDNYVEENAEYSPFEFIKQSDGSWARNNKVNKYKTIAYWAYDGNSENIKNQDIVLYLDFTENTNCRTYNYETFGTYNYNCPPDLFRFCSDSADLDVTGVFKNSGLLRMNPVVQGLPHESYRAQQFGMTGRICPYLLKPISEVTDISEMFYSCKRISGYDSDSGFFLIPKDFFSYAKKINTLVKSFAYLLIPGDTNFNDVFLPLKPNTLNINSLFIGSIWGSCKNVYTGYLNDTKETVMTVSNLFNEFNFNNITLSFANGDNISSDSGFAYSQYVTFDNVFDKKYSNSIYNSEKYLNNFRAAFKGYNANTIKFLNLNLINDTITQNYQLIGGNIWKTSTTFNLRRPNSNIDNNIEEWTTMDDQEFWAKENPSTFLMNGDL